MLAGVVAPACPGLVWGNSAVLYWLLAGLLTVLVVRELLQLSLGPARYLASPENLMELLTAGLALLLLLPVQPGCHQQFRREIGSAAILLSWIELVLMIGRHPRLAACNIYSTMFFSVLKTFLAFLAWYSLFIISFSLSFYILLHDDTGQEDKEYPYFDQVGLTLVKTFSMFVGELEFSDLPLNSPFR